jgi:hypothetical protein
LTAGLAFLWLIAAGTQGCTESKKTTQSVAANADKSTSQPQAPEQRTFASAEEAMTAIVAAMRSHDSEQLRQILGPDGDDLISSGDDVADRQSQDRFLAKYDQKHRLIPDEKDDGTVNVTVGSDDWPMPIPIVRDDATKRWSFDTEAGEDELINRRIGRNELDVIQVLKAICDAQTDYASQDPAGEGIPVYARYFISKEGKKDGLFWHTDENQPRSPLGPLVAGAAEEGYKIGPRQDDQPHPYHGYFYHILTAQGPAAPGGALDYTVNGKLIGGFAVVAWPADYGNSGITTFIMRYDGVVYQRDLGEDTDKAARAITAFDPSPGWTKAE